MLKVQKFQNFTSQDDETWKILYKKLDNSRKNQAFYIFQEGLDALNIIEDRIPDIEEVNKRLKDLTGWQGVPVEGLEEGDTFYPALARKEFPIGNFIRDKSDLSYTPAPDVFHDLYGHIPNFANKDYANFCCEYGKRASKYVGQPEKLEKFERLFWFTIEFALIKTEKGPQIFGAGILSSQGECNYSLSDEPEVIPFDLKLISEQAYRIDEMQKKLFILESPEQLYGCLDQFEDVVNG